MNKAKRKAIIAGNWKMNNTPAQTTALINEMKPLVADADCEVVLCVPFVDIPAAVEAAKGSNIKIGAENVHFKDNGAYTGEVAADMLVELGVEYVVMEVSSQALKLQRVAGCNFDVGVFTNFSKEHISQKEHSDMEEYFNSQSKFILSIINKIVYEQLTK